MGTLIRTNNFCCSSTFLRENDDLPIATTGEGGRAPGTDDGTEFLGVEELDTGADGTFTGLVFIDEGGGIGGA